MENKTFSKVAKASYQGSSEDGEQSVSFYFGVLTNSFTLQPEYCHIPTERYADCRIYECVAQQSWEERRSGKVTNCFQMYRIANDVELVRTFDFSLCGTFIYP